MHPLFRKVTVFIPPYNAFNADTVTALKLLGYTHMTSQVELDPPPYPTTGSNFHRFFTDISGQTFYRFPEGAATDDENLVNVLPYSVGITAAQTMVDVQKQVTSYGYSVGKSFFANFTYLSTSYDSSYGILSNSRKRECGRCQCNYDRRTSQVAQFDTCRWLRTCSYWKT